MPVLTYGDVIGSRVRFYLDVVLKDSQQMQITSQDKWRELKRITDRHIENENDLERSREKNV